jgi:orotate phosphoribosyltransferase
MKIFKDCNAYHKGHFKLSSGLHSGYYLQCALVLEDPKVAAKLCGELAKKFSAKGGSASGGKAPKIDVVIGPAIGGITAAYEVARALGARGIFSEREKGKMALRRGFKLNRGERVLVIEDVTTTGGSAKEVVKMAKALGARVVGVGAIIDRSGGKAEFGVPFRSLAKLNIKTYQPNKCLLCKEGIPISKPGSRIFG